MLTSHKKMSSKTSAAKQSALPRPTLQGDFKILIAAIPLRRRREIRSSITNVQTALNLPDENLIVDRRFLRRLSTDPGRLAFQRAFRNRLQTVKNLRFEFRDERADEHQCYSLADASVMMGKQIPTIRNYLSRSRGVWETSIGDRLVTIRRLDDPLATT